MALVSLIDGERLFFKSVAGTDCRQGVPLRQMACRSGCCQLQNEKVVSWLPSVAASIALPLSLPQPSLPMALQATGCTPSATPACVRPTPP